MDLNLNKDVIEGNWMQIKGQVMEAWGRLALDGRAVAMGRRAQFDGRVAKRRGLREAQSRRSGEHRPEG